MNSFDFEPWPKIPRLKGNAVTITEKLDGTNAQVNITEMSPSREGVIQGPHVFTSWNLKKYAVQAGSRKRWIGPNEIYGKGSDNFGFAQWVWEHAEELVRGLGEGRHYGEWYGQGIQRGYGLEEKRFALFNTHRWGAHNPNTPGCCEVVPVLFSGPDDGDAAAYAMHKLDAFGSAAVHGFDNPEGIIVYHHASRTMMKQTFDNPEGKWAA